MNKHSSPSDIAEQVDASVASTDALRADALARRRLLLKGAGTGAAAMAALAPMGAMAQIKPNVFICKKGADQFVCTISGVQSAGHSFGANITPVPVSGQPVAWWGAKNPTNANRPKNAWPSSTTCAPTKLVKDIFGTGAEYAGTSQFVLMRDYASSDMAHWLCAYLNASAYIGTFPYTPQSVQNQFNGGPDTRAKALLFYKTYLEGGRT